MNGVETKYFNDDVERDEELGEIKIGSKNNKIKIKECKSSVWNNQERRENTGNTVEPAR